MGAIGIPIPWVRGCTLGAAPGDALGAPAILLTLARSISPPHGSASTKDGAT